jgi:hypothetical protein
MIAGEAVGACQQSAELVARALLAKHCRDHLREDQGVLADDLGLTRRGVEALNKALRNSSASARISSKGMFILSRVNSTTVTRLRSDCWTSEALIELNAKQLRIW